MYIPAMTGVPIVPCPDLMRSRVYMSMVVSPVHVAFKDSSTEHRSQDPSHVQSWDQIQLRTRSVLLSILVYRRCLANPRESFPADGQ